MSEPFIGQIKIFGGNFAPRSYAFCDGQLLPIAQNTALFSILSTTYGGDGRTTFGLPNLQGRAAMHPGRGPGLTSRRLGEKGGTNTVNLAEAQIPAHDHIFNIHAGGSNTNEPGNAALANSRGFPIYSKDTNTTNMASAALSNSGGGQAHANLQPYLGLNFIIALQGTYPSRG